MISHYNHFKVYIMSNWKKRVMVSWFIEWQKKDKSWTKLWQYSACDNSRKNLEIQQTVADVDGSPCVEGYSLMFGMVVQIQEIC